MLARFGRPQCVTRSHLRQRALPVRSLRCITRPGDEQLDRLSRPHRAGPGYSLVQWALPACAPSVGIAATNPQRRCWDVSERAFGQFKGGGGVVGRGVPRAAAAPEPYRPPRRLRPARGAARPHGRRRAAPPRRRPGRADRATRRARRRRGGAAQGCGPPGPPGPVPRPVPGGPAQREHPDGARPGREVPGGHRGGGAAARRARGQRARQRRLLHRGRADRPPGGGGRGL